MSAEPVLSIREQIISALVTAIEDESGMPTVYRSRSTALAVNQLPAVVVSPVRDVPGEGTSLCWQAWELEIMVEVVVNTEPQDQAADPIMIGVHSALMEGDRTLGISAVTDVQPRQVDFMVEHQGHIIPMNRMSYVVSYRTQHEDLTTAP
jgi:hypothetical protein